MPQRFTLIIVIAIALAGCSPKEFADLAYKMERWPGQRIGGTEQPAPADFDFVNQSAHDLVQLKVSGDILPHVVNLWAVGMGDSIYLWTNSSTGWGQRIDKRPDVWVRVGDDVYALSSTRITDPAERQLVFVAFMAKYDKGIRRIFRGIEPTTDHFEIFLRLVPRG